MAGESEVREGPHRAMERSMSKDGLTGKLIGLLTWFCLLLPGMAAGNIDVFGTVLINGGPINPGPGDQDAGPAASVVVDEASILIINGGSTLTAGTLFAAALSSGPALQMTDSGSRLNLLGNGVRVNSGAAASLQLLNGAVLDADDLTNCLAQCGVIIGEFAGSTTSLQVSGAGSQLLSVTDFVIGQAFTDVALSLIGASTGTVVVDGGGRIDSGRVLVAAGVFNDLSLLSASVGVVTINGTNSQWNASELVIGAGDTSDGSVVVSSGGRFNVSGALLMGVSGSSASQLDIIGAGSRVNAQSGVISAQGSADVSIQTGGELSIARGLIVGSSDAEATGLVTVDGSGSILKVGDDLIVGDGALGFGQIDLTSGGRLEVGGGADSNANGTFMVIGAPAGAGELNVSASTVIVDNQGLSGFTRLNVGEAGVGDLMLTNGSTLNVISSTSGPVFSGMKIGSGSGLNSAIGSVLVDASTLLIRSPGATLDVGEVEPSASLSTSGAGFLDVINGGLVRVDGQTGIAQLRVANGANATGSVTISGGRLELIGQAANIFLGHDANGSAGNGDAQLRVINNGLLSVAGSSAVSTTVFVGLGTGDGTLDVNTGGRVDIAGQLRISTPRPGHDTQIGLVLITDTGVLNTISTVIGNRGILQGDGLFTAETLFLQSGGTLLLNNLSGVGGLVIEGGSLVNSTFSFGRSTGQSLQIINAGLLSTTSGLDFGTQTNTRANVSLFNGGRIITSGDLRLGNTTGDPSVLSLQADGRVDVSGSLIVAAGSAVFAGTTGSTLNVQNVVLNGGDLSVGPAGGVTIAGTIVVNNAGRLAGSRTTAGSVAINAGGTLAMSDLTGFVSAVLDSGRLEMPGGRVTVGHLQSGGQTISAIGASVLQVQVMNIGVDPNLQGRVLLDGTSTLLASSEVVVGGSGLRSELRLSGSSSAVINQRLLINSNGLTSVSGTGVPVLNTPFIEVLGGTLSVNSGIVRANSILVGAGGLLDAVASSAVPDPIQSGLVTVNAGGSLRTNTLAGVTALRLDGGDLQLLGDLLLTNSGSDVLMANGALGAIGGRIDLRTGTSINVTGASTRLTASGNLQLNGGNLILAGGGTVQAGPLTVGASSLLGGTGTVISPNVLIGPGGTLAPGNSPGTLNVQGNVRLDGGRFLFELGGTGAGQFDVLNVTGNLDLVSGAVELQPFNGFRPRSGETFDIFTVTGTTSVGPGVQLTFNGLGPDFEVGFVNNGQLNVGTLKFLNIDIQQIIGLSENQTGMALYFDDVCPRIEGLTNAASDEMDLDLVCGNLRNSRNTPEQIAAALDAISPEEILGLVDTLLRFTTVQHGNLSQRLSGLRSGRMRVDVSGLDIMTDNVRISGPDLQRFAENLIGGAAGGTDDFAKWGFFSDGNFHFGDKTAGEHESGFDFDTVNITLGADYRLSSSLFVGGAFGYNEINADFDSGGGLLMKASSLSLMGTWFHGETLYVDAMATYGWTDSDTSRIIRYTDTGGLLSRRATGHTDGSQLLASVGSGMDFGQEKWIYGPHAGSSYTEVRLDDFNEEGALGLNLVIPNQVTRSFTANAGVHLSYTATPGWGVFVPYLRIDYVHEFEDAGQEENVSLVADRFRFDPLDPSRPAAVRTDDADADYWAWSVGAHAQFVHGFSAFLNYKGTQGIKDLDLGEITVGLRFERGL